MIPRGFMVRLFGFCTAITLLTSSPALSQSCTNPTGDAGDIFYNNNYDVFQGCSAAMGWLAFHEPQCADGSGCVTDPCTGTSTLPTIGETCTDGSYFIGDIGAGPVYATNESFESQEAWNDGNTNYSTTGATSLTDGAGNTATLVTADSDDVTAGVQPHDAAIYCDGLSAHGHSDWYLPAQDELDLFWNDGDPVANVNTSGSLTAGRYWSSSEANSTSARSQRFSGGSQRYSNKGFGLAVRCVRR